MQPQESIRLDINVPIKMRDGINLYADIWRPVSKKKFPAILVRFPYNKSKWHTANGSGYLNFQRTAQSGYAVIIQDMRGTGVSEGEFYFFLNDREDGYDSVEWAAKQTWCDGNVGMYGFSSFGTSQWQAAAALPPHLKTICPAMTSVEPPFCEGGTLVLGFLLYYLSMFELSYPQNKLDPHKLSYLKEKYVKIMDNAAIQFNYLPLKESEANKLIEEIGMPPIFTDFILHLEDKDYWKRLGSPLPVENINLPVFHMTGWYDHLLKDMLNGYSNMKNRNSLQFALNNQRLLIGPWLHSEALSSMVGPLNFGIKASGESIDVTRMHINWFDHWLKGIDNTVEKQAPVKIYIMGDNLWRDEQEWPLARTKYTNYFFHSLGKANSCSGDGNLNTQLPDQEPTDNYLYDPRTPVPGGFTEFDQTKVENRNDVLVYTSAPLKEDIEVTGPLKIMLYAASSAEDTDFTGMLLDVNPDGRSIKLNAVGGIIRARYRDSQFKPKLIKPGKVYRYIIDLGGTGNIFKAGHRIRVQISSSFFPYWDRNLNTGHPIGQDVEIEPAIQTIYHNNKYASHIVLPVIPAYNKKFGPTNLDGMVFQTVKSR